MLPNYLAYYCNFKVSNFKDIQAKRLTDYEIQKIDDNL
jgi:hypothetical protein